MTNPHSDTIVAALRQTHWTWRKEIGEVLAPVRQPEAGVWERWSAARYLTGEFAPRLDREQQVLTTLAERLPAEQSGHVWALGELLEFLCRYLCEIGRMPQAGPAFARAVNKLVRAFEFWCAEVEVGVEAATATGGFAADIARELAAVPDRAKTAVPA